MRLPRQLALPLVSGAALLALGVPAIAQEAPIVIVGDAHHNRELVRERVNIADLNMATAVGQQQAQLRVDKAINRVCPLAAGNLPQHEREMLAECRKTAEASAKAQMDQAIAHAKAARKHG